jgi:hypothetical protein
VRADSMFHGCAASFGLLISVNSNQTNYKILRAESNKRNEKFLQNKIRRDHAGCRRDWPERICTLNL